MKNQVFLSFEELAETVGRLENFLYDHHYTQMLWPIDDLDEADITNFINALFRLSWECIAIQNRINMPRIPDYRAGVFGSGDISDMIRFTRQLVQCCDELAIEEYRLLTLAETETIRLLRELHAALIGDYYFQHPGLENVKAADMRFR